MNKLVAIRLTDAQENVEGINKALEKAKARRKGAKDVEQEIRQLRFADGVFQGLNSLIEHCERLNTDKGGDWGTFRTKITELSKAARESYKTLDSGLANLASRAATLGKSNFKGKQLDAHISKTEELVSDKQLTLKGIRSEARKGTSARSLLNSINDAKPLWDEHIETIAGMILRDDGFDEGSSNKGSLSDLADQIIDICSDHSKFGATSTLNVLGRDDAVLKDLRYTVYFRFPTWSVWGLPLIAHEFWHASWHAPSSRLTARLNKTLDPEVSKLLELRFVQDCLADTFATLVIGPAYAFACILLLLDAVSPQDRVRAEIIFATLKHLAKGEEPWYEFISELERSWIEAIESEPGGLESAPCLLVDGRSECDLVNSLMHSCAPQRNGKLSDGVVCRLAHPPAQCSMRNSAVVKEICNVLLDFVPDDIRYSTNPWSESALKILNFLQADTQRFESMSVESLNLSPDLDLRDVLYAGWLTRWTEPEKDRKQVNELAKRVEQLCFQTTVEMPQQELAADPNGPS